MESADVFTLHFLMVSNPERAVCFLVAYNAARNYLKHHKCTVYIYRHINEISQCTQCNEIYSQSKLNFSNSVFSPFKPLWDGLFLNPRIFLILHLFALIVGYNSVC